MTQDEISRYIELRRKEHRGEAFTAREMVDFKRLEERHREMLSKRAGRTGER